MKKLSKSIISILLVLSLTCTLLPIESFANPPRDINVPPMGYLSMKEYAIDIDDVELEKNETTNRPRLSKSVSLYSASADYWRKYESKYYYNQLDDTQKLIYDELYSVCMGYLTSNNDISCYSDPKYNTYITKPGTNDLFSGRGLSTKRVKETASIFVNANPQFYFMAGDGFLYGESEGICKLFTINCYTNYVDGNYRNQQTELIRNKIESWIREINAQISEIDKVKKIYELVANAVTYDNDSSNLQYHQSIATAVLEGKTVCAGYSELFEILARGAGLDSVVVTYASSTGSIGHEWNEVKIGDYWYNVDVTWGDDDDVLSWYYFGKSDHDYPFGTGAHTPEPFYEWIRPQCPYNVDDFPSEKVKYNISYELNGGTIFNPNPTEYTYGEGSPILSFPAKNGYDFDGWYKYSDFSGKKLDRIPPIYTGDIKLYAKWIPMEYTIEYVLNGGNSNSNPTTYTVETPTIILLEPTKKGNDFAGWYKNSNFSGERVTQINKGSTGDISLYAKWKLATYKVTYELNGGVLPKNYPSQYKYGDKIEFFNSPERTGYTFDGWYKNSNFTGEKVFGISSQSEGDIKLYAKWVPINYTIKYSLNGGNSNNNPTTYTIETPTINLLAPSKKGYSFSGWYANSNFSGEKVTQIARGSIGNVSLYAKWNLEKYKISYKNLGGANNDDNPTGYNVTTDTFTLTKPTRTGYTFKGWYTDSEYTDRITSINKGSTGNKILYAKWSANKYYISYNKNGGKGSMSKQTRTYGKSYNLAKNKYTKKGYTFVGWATSKDGKVVYNNKANIKNLTSKDKKTIKLYAKWVKNIKKYTITYSVGKNAKNSAKNPKKYTVKTDDIKLKSPTRKGYTFKGWYTNSKYTGTKVSVIKKGSYGNIKLYAKWVKKN